jgi:K+-transporting ATPase ATPase A chain
LADPRVFRVGIGAGAVSRAFYYKVMEGQRTWLTPILGPVERGCYRLAGVDPQAEQSWQKYAGLARVQPRGLLAAVRDPGVPGPLPLNPQNLPGQEWTLAFNTASAS